jgi:hypothetical protein
MVEQSGRQMLLTVSFNFHCIILNYPPCISYNIVHIRNFNPNKELPQTLNLLTGICSVSDENCRAVADPVEIRWSERFKKITYLP